jgi:hypothetical protein
VSEMPWTRWNARAHIEMSTCGCSQEMIWSRSSADKRTDVPPKRYLPSVSGPGLNLQKQLYWMWAVSMIHNVNYLKRRLLTKNKLDGIWQCEVISASTGD